MQILGCRHFSSALASVVLFFRCHSQFVIFSVLVTFVCVFRTRFVYPLCPLCRLLLLSSPLMFIVIISCGVRCRLPCHVSYVFCVLNDQLSPAASTMLPRAITHVPVLFFFVAVSGTAACIALFTIGCSRWLEVLFATSGHNSLALPAANEGDI